MIITIGNIKGGVGKSTVAFNVGMWLRENSESRVNFIDLDPQQTLNDTVKVRQELGHTPTIDSISTKVPDVFNDQDDYVIDVSVADKEAMFKALEKTDIVIVPCMPSQSDVWATGKFVDMLKLLYPKLNVILFINRADTHPGNKDGDEAEAALREIENAHYVDVRLHSRVAYRKSFSEGKSLRELKTDKKATQEFDELMARIFE